MAKTFYGWWRKLQLLMDVRMMERMVRILTFLFAHVLFNVILLFKFCSYSSVCLCARLRIGEAWGGGSPIVKIQGRPSSRFGASDRGKFWSDRGDGNPNIFTHTDIA